MGISDGLKKKYPNLHWGRLFWIGMVLLIIVLLIVGLLVRGVVKKNAVTVKTEPVEVLNLKKGGAKISFIASDDDASSLKVKIDDGKEILINVGGGKFNNEYDAKTKIELTVLKGHPTIVIQNDQYGGEGLVAGKDWLKTEKRPATTVIQLQEK